MIQPIETRYKGVLFRSRTEARWAVFLDSLNIKWYFEHEGYDLGRFGWYLPDFWLPEAAVYIEVKPFELSQADLKYAQDRCHELASCSGSDVLLALGIPQVGRFALSAFRHCPDGSVLLNESTFAQCRKCDDEFFYGHDDWGFSPLSSNETCTCEKWPMSAAYSDRLLNAFESASSFRFVA